MNRVLTAFIVLTLCITTAAIAFAAGSQLDSTVRTYDIISDNEDIGDFTVTRKRGANPEEVGIHSKTKIALSGFLWSYSLTMDSRYEFKGAVLQAFDHTIIEDGNKSTIKGKQGRDLIKATIKEADATKPQTAEIDSRSYDATLEGFPRYAIKALPVKPGTEIKLLDTVEFTIVPYTMLSHEEGSVTILKKQYDCNIFKLKTPEGESTYWIAQDDLGPFLVKESGKDQDGPYEVLMRESK